VDPLKKRRQSGIDINNEAYKPAPAEIPEIGNNF